ncbi:hypothetical protein WOLCODRAFT_159112 [Wolfiporia cocos MD-104 SS10]|uniref:Uncharacterized protein n=1 Tax=Wolfiporia cocos (strain MD-104) TaxID=742152 RepID=A0A2H3JL54_WOLCO|nr:hypothetical protein WOLCODRAFT_159112 [Wolfiporia cocos MD-104 SS10]
MLAQRGSRPDDKSQRSVQVRAPIQAQLKSPTWGNEEDDGPMAHPTAVSRYETRLSLTRVGEGRRPCNQPCNGSAACLTNRALGLDDPQLHPAPRAFLPGRTNAWGIASAPAPVVWATAQALGTPGAAPDQQPSTPAPQSTQGQPNGPPTRTIKTRQPHHGHRTSESNTRTPPDHSGSDKAIPANDRAPAEGHTARATARVEQTQPQATATSPPAYQTQGRAKAHSRQGNPPRTKSNGSADCLNNRATPSADRAHMLSSRARSQQSRKAARTNGNGQAPRTGQSPPSKAYQGTVRITNGTGIRRDDKGPPAQPHLLRERRELAQQRDAKPRASCQGAQQGAGGMRTNLPPIQFSQESESDAQRSRLKTHRQPLSTPLDSDAVTAPQAKAAARETSQAKDKKEKSKKANLWELNTHVGLGQPRTRHHAQSGRSGHLSDTVPLAEATAPQGVKTRAHLRHVP